MRKSFLATWVLPLTLMLSACGGGADLAQANRPPTANAGPAQSVVAGSAVQLSGSGSDPDLDILSYAWTFTKPQGSAANLLNYHAATPTFVTDLPGAYVATLTVNDGKLDSAPSSVTITAH